MNEGEGMDGSAFWVLKGIILWMLCNFYDSK